MTKNQPITVLVLLGESLCVPETNNIVPETKSRGIFTNIHKPEANNCFSIITRVIIEIELKKLRSVL